MYSMRSGRVSFMQSMSFSSTPCLGGSSTSTQSSPFFRAFSRTAGNASSHGAFMFSILPSSPFRILRSSAHSTASLTISIPMDFFAFDANIAVSIPAPL